MSNLKEILALLTDSQQIISVGGLALVTIIVFCETGLFFAFFLPGDYLLFSAGLLTATGVLQVPVWQLLICIYLAAIAGNLTGFLFGRYLGHKLETMRESFFFKREYMRNTEKAFVRYGGRALIVGRFLPIIRTFAPIMAGATHMNFSTFIGYNILGASLWVPTLTLSGYFLGREFPQIVDYIEYIILAFVAFTSLVLVRTVFSLGKKQTPPEANPTSPAAVASTTEQ
jgi:membrane-associated protein